MLLFCFVSFFDSSSSRLQFSIVFSTFFIIFPSPDINQAHKNRQICSLIGVEGGHSLGGSLGVLRTFYSLGVRYMTLTSTCHTPWADSSNADAPKYDVKHGGLTAYGKVS
jgi:microsomal dipeptidase-like Zn-dependent dipeptidase